MERVNHFWNKSAEDLIHILASDKNGLSSSEAAARLKEQEKEKRVLRSWQKDILLLLAQYKNPLILILVFAVVLSLILGEYSDSSIILAVLLSTGVLGFAQERNAGKAVEELRAIVRNKAAVQRDGTEVEIDIDHVVQGDIVLLNAGDIIPADSIILEANDLHVNEAALTGESFPAEKFPGISNKDASLAERSNVVFKGANVINGTASVLAVHTGRESELGKMYVAMTKVAPETAFEKGIRSFGYLLMRLTVIISATILVLNIFFHKPVVDSILFALALSVGLAPELLPAIVTITLSAGAKRMAAKKVIVKKLNAIQNLGEMDVLCSDKTGTLTEGLVKVLSAIGANGEANDKVKQYAYLNASFESGFFNPIDEALRNFEAVNSAGFTKTDEVPYDFIRKRLSIVVDNGSGHIMITKGAFRNILECCTLAEISEGTIVSLDKVKDALEEMFQQFGRNGIRTIAVCYKDVTNDPVINKDDESEMIFLGFVNFYDPPKGGIIDSIQGLRETGISLKIITGDNHFVSQYMAAQIGLPVEEILTGKDIQSLTAEALQRKVEEVQVFAEIEPIQKERIVRALQKNGHAVGYLGDGINDANALKVADVGISIENAVDVAKEAAALVLLEKNIDVIRDGVLEGRKTFMNTLKYIFVTTSANFGNMFSMAAASLFLPFLPLLPTQILLNNFLSDMPSLAIASDKVDTELLMKPRRWDIRYIRRFMIVFGIQSSLFDFITFALLLLVFKAMPDEFRTGWFMESLLTEILILLVIRTQRPFFKSKPSNYLLLACLFTFFASLFLPYLPFASLFSFYPLSFSLIAGIIIIAIAYIWMAELTKKYFMKRL